ncbi:BTB/POZ and MATH domain-containing protein 2-like [Triticum urartu]|nr:BTB/POZ and MATH domain-containing protein 2-like [Triticum aestivum]XP_048552377.1 BTB/POZ and MATH domain-containing protein 2-like [Triticum urartu]
MAEHCKLAAAMVAESEERSYVVKVDGYSRVKGLLKNGEFVISTPFSVGGHNWNVEYYPNGYPEDCSDFISLYLFHESADAGDVKAKFTVSVLDKNGEPVASCNRTSDPVTFSKEVSYCGYDDFIKKADLEASAHLRDDCFTIRFDVTVIKDIHGEEKSVPPSDLHRHFGDMLKNKDAADLTFKVGGQEFSAHRCVLAARSPVFKAELLGAMEESSSSTIEIHDMEPDVFESLLHFIYTDSAPVLQMASEKSEPCVDVVMAGHLLVAADRYNIGRLRVILEEKLCSHIDSSMVATSLALAEQHGFHRLKEACFQFLSSPPNLEAMMASDGYEHLKSSCPSVLKELIARIIPAEWKAAKDIIMAI